MKTNLNEKLYLALAVVLAVSLSPRTAKQTSRDFASTSSGGNITTSDLGRCSANIAKGQTTCVLMDEKGMHVEVQNAQIETDAKGQSKLTEGTVVATATCQEDNCPHTADAKIQIASNQFGDIASVLRTGAQDAKDKAAKNLAETKSEAKKKKDKELAKKNCEVDEDGDPIPDKSSKRKLSCMKDQLAKLSGKDKEKYQEKIIEPYFQAQVAPNLQRMSLTNPMAAQAMAMQYGRMGFGQDINSQLAYVNAFSSAIQNQIQYRQAKSRIDGQVNMWQSQLTRWQAQPNSNRQKATQVANLQQEISQAQQSLQGYGGFVQGEMSQMSQLGARMANSDFGTDPGLNRFEYASMGLMNSFQPGAAAASPALTSMILNNSTNATDSLFGTPGIGFGGGLNTLALGSAGWAGSSLPSLNLGASSTSVFDPSISMNPLMDWSAYPSNGSNIGNSLGLNAGISILPPLTATNTRTPSKTN